MQADGYNFHNPEDIFTHSKINPLDYFTNGVYTGAAPDTSSERFLDETFGKSYITIRSCRTYKDIHLQNYWRLRQPQLKTEQELRGPMDERAKMKFFLDGHIHGRTIIIGVSRTFPHIHHRCFKNTREYMARGYWWPGFSSDIKKFIKDCTHCKLERRQARRERRDGHRMSV